jgi:hypothetical protein
MPVEAPVEDGVQRARRLDVSGSRQDVVKLIGILPRDVPECNLCKSVRELAGQYERGRHGITV